MTDPDLTALRQLAQDLANQPDWPGVLTLAPRLRADTAYWFGVWAPLVAIAARQTGDPSARSYLDEALEGGFSQPENLEGELERAFGSDPDWPAIEAAIVANVPPAALELLDWPELSPAHPLVLTRIADDRVEELRRQIPPAHPSAWETARDLLVWVAGRWQHSATAHVEWDDAVHVLSRVEAGERFACREYALVLSQALNVVGIPARSVTLLQANHHSGLGRAHAASEAWIDDLDSWVLLDGQNGMYWVDSTGRPLDVTALRRLQRAGGQPAEVVSLAGRPSAQSALWWPYFRSVGPAGAMVSSAPYAPMIEGTLVQACGQLLREPAGLHPNLSELGIGIADVAGVPAIQPVTRHPYATGFEITVAEHQWQLPVAGQPWPIPTAVGGERTATIAIVTGYGTHHRRAVRYAVHGRPGATP